MLSGRLLRRCVHLLVFSPGARAFRRRLLLAPLLLLFLLLFLARPETQYEMEAHTLVLKAGFPLTTIDNSTTNKRPPPHQPHLSPIRHGVAPLSLPPSHPKLAARVQTQKPKWLNSNYKPPLRQWERPPNCQKLIQNDATEQDRGNAFMKSHEPVEKTPSDYLRETQNCSKFISDRGYIMEATSEERAFPIAYNMMMYTGIEQAERLLRAIYRPHNYHCIHVDLKSPEDLMQGMRAIAGCLPNVFVASKLNKVYWATWSSLEALIFCMEDLWKVSKKWKYYINLTGQEFPLKTNLQLVRILTALNGSNIVDASTDPVMTVRWYNTLGPPHGIVPYKGMVFMVACRGFVDYILHNQTAHDFLKWVSYTDMPDETFFPSLNHNPHLKVPGSYKGPPDTNAITKPYLARYVSWDTQWRDGQGHYNFRHPCYGMRVRGVCIFGMLDLPLLTNRKELFANKLYSSFEPLTMKCMEEWLLDITVKEYAGLLSLNTTFYSSLDIVRNKVL